VGKYEPPPLISLIDDNDLKELDKSSWIISWIFSSWNNSRSTYFLVSKDKVGASYVFPYCRTCFVPSFGKATVQAGIGHHNCLICCSRYVLVGVRMDFSRMILSSLRDECLHVPCWSHPASRCFNGRSRFLSAYIFWQLLFKIKILHKQFSWRCSSGLLCHLPWCNCSRVINEVKVSHYENEESRHSTAYSRMGPPSRCGKGETLCE
jgi:hypothetical protein